MRLKRFVIDWLRHISGLPPRMNWISGSDMIKFMRERYGSDDQANQRWMAEKA